MNHKALAYISVIVVAALAVSVLLVPPVHALAIADGANAARGDGQPALLFGAGGLVSTLVNFLLFAIGALSVIMIMFGGLRYVISGGNSSAVTAAKNTILYAIIGLVVSFFAYAIVQFIMAALTGSSIGPTNV